MGNNEICLQRSEKMISVIVPIYNIRPDIFKKCLDSLKNQTFLNYEVLLIDDGSAPYVAEICRKYQKHDKRFCYYYQSNNGQAAARNKGIQMAGGEYLCFVDADDWVDEAYLETLYALICNTGADIAVVDCTVHYKRGTAANHFLDVPESVLTGSEKNKLLYQLLGKKICPYYPREIAVGVPWAKLYKKHFIETNRISYINGLKRMQDNVLNMYAFEFASGIAYKPVCLYHYRKTEGSVTTRYNPHIVDDFEFYYREASRYLASCHKEEILWKALSMKELTSFHSYLSYDYLHASAGLSNAEVKQKLNELLEREPYKTALSHVSRELLTRQEYVFVCALRNRMVTALRSMIAIRKWGKEHQIYGF